MKRIKSIYNYQFVKVFLIIGSVTIVAALGYFFGIIIILILVPIAIFGFVFTVFFYWLYRYIRSHINRIRGKDDIPYSLLRFYNLK